MSSDNERNPPAAGIALTLSHGGEGCLETIAGERLMLRTTLASAPGSRLNATLDDGSVVQLKVHSCRRGPDGQFTIQGRAFNLTRQQRQKLQLRLSSVDALSASDS